MPAPQERAALFTCPKATENLLSALGEILVALSQGRAPRADTVFVRPRGNTYRLKTKPFLDPEDPVMAAG
jgi:hypothetical protein